MSGTQKMYVCQLYIRTQNKQFPDYDTTGISYLKIVLQNPDVLHTPGTNYDTTRKSQYSKDHRGGENAKTVKQYQKMNNTSGYIQ